MNDRQLRHVIVDGLGGEAGRAARGWLHITVASEVMAILCLSTDINDLKARLARIVVGYTFAGEPVRARRPRAVGAMAALLKDALKPNLVQTLEGTPGARARRPVCEHRARLQLYHRHDYGAASPTTSLPRPASAPTWVPRSSLDLKCRFAGVSPSAVVVVATVRALKMHGGLAKDELGTEDLRRSSAAFPTCCSM